MSQISPPIRILLVCAVALMAAWMLFLRPSTETGDLAAAAPTPPANATPVEAGGPKADSVAGKAVEQANEATAATDARVERIADGTETVDDAASAANAKAATAARAPAPDASAAATAKPGEPAQGDLPLRVRRALGAKQVVALLFWNPRAADDRAVRKALTGIDRHRGKVLAHATNVKKIARYQQITRGAQVEQSPSIVVIDRSRKVQTLVGFVDRTSIDQAVSDALRKRR